MKCLKKGCRGNLDIKFVNVFKYQVKCNKCGKSRFFPRSLKIFNPTATPFDKVKYTRGI